MEKTDLYKIYMFGWDFHMLWKGRKYNSVESALEFIDKIIRFIEKNHLDVTSKVIEDERFRLLPNLDSQKPEEKVSDKSFSEMKEFANAIEKTLDAELRLKHSFILTPKRLDLKKLLENMPSLYGDGIFEKFSDFSKKDFHEAGKCIAFERPTAAAFHIMRGTEETLRVFYRKKIPKKDHISPLLWKPMIDQMRKKPKISKTILDSFDNIRANFRNPTSHPESFYTMDEIQDLLLLCIEANSRAVRK